MRTNELMLYKSMEHGEILDNITFLMENYDNEYYNREDLKSLLFECIHELLELSVRHGFEGNLWHTYLTFLLASDENAYGEILDNITFLMENYDNEYYNREDLKKSVV